MLQTKARHSQCEKRPFGGFDEGTVSFWSEFENCFRSWFRNRFVFILSNCLKLLYIYINEYIYKTTIEIKFIEFEGCYVVLSTLNRYMHDDCIMDLVEIPDLFEIRD